MSEQGQNTEGAGVRPVSVLPESFARQPELRTKDARLLAKAVRQGWNLPDEIKDVLPQLALAMAKGLRVDPITREKLRMSETGQIRAMGLLVNMVGQNLELRGAVGADLSESNEIDLSQFTVEELRLLDAALGREQDVRHDQEAAVS